jgi:protein-tyrosine-phosphatase/DNA-binding transcriptional ArsR family regulator
VKADSVVPAEPPLLFQMGADPVRWSLLHALSGTDRRVGELCAAVARPQNLVSYHLRKLRGSGLVTFRRSSADGRDTYYALDLPRSAALFAAASAALHPGLALAVPSAPDAVLDRRAASVLFACTGNSSRSQIAEALFNRSAEGLGHAVSAGSHPKPVHPETARVLTEHGIDARRLRSKHLSDVAAGSFDYVITLCDKVREVCPEFPESPTALHWSIPDPAATENETGVRAAFDAVADELATRISFLIKSIHLTSLEGASP